ncbi:MAG TPA: hypothetical protein VFJ57_08055 [Solirubrobacterales bacterium]|nr:hypothetical protein [Solirubrobacterales bacterium]
MTGTAKKLLALGMALVLSAVVLAAPAGAEPTGEFAEFNQCEYENVEVSTCIHWVFDSGTIKLGEKAIPVTNPITLQGSLVPESDLLLGATNGVTLSHTPQAVPGGLLGITAPGSWPEWLQGEFNNQINEGFTGVTATVELVGPSSGQTNVTLNTENLLFEEGTALTLPVKIHLQNPILGSNCYFGSNSEPIDLHLTTGISGAFKGSAGELMFNEAFTLIDLTNVRLVDGTFAAPSASGCGGIASEYIDPLVDSIFGTPAGAGENHAVLEGTFTEADREAVLNSGP